MGTSVLIVDDDKELCSLLTEFLLLEGFDCHSIHDGAEAVEHCKELQYDAIVLDVMLPGMQGLDVLRQLRRFIATPVLMLTARGEDTDRIIGLELGADDYLPKPCNPRELAARLRAILRRANTRETSRTQNTLQVEMMTLCTSDRSARYKEHSLSLTSAEFNILLVLMGSAGETVSKDTLSELALGRPLSAYDRSIDVHISKIRRKLAEHGGNNLILSVRGLGYQLCVTPGVTT
tara:strand:+ start:30335 stop:31036 length:702 start_codon:yes stop_codon:yes gene_type:complete